MIIGSALLGYQLEDDFFLLLEVPGNSYCKW